MTREPCCGCSSDDAEHVVDDEHYCDVCAAGLVLLAQRCLERLGLERLGQRAEVPS